MCDHSGTPVWQRFHSTVTIEAGVCKSVSARPKKVSDSMPDSEAGLNTDSGPHANSGPDSDGDAAHEAPSFAQDARRRSVRITSNPSSPTPASDAEFERVPTTRQLQLPESDEFPAPPVVP